MERTILENSHYILYTIVTAIQPRMLITVDEDLNPLPVSVRVGQAVSEEYRLRFRELCISVRLSLCNVMIG